MGFLNTQMRYMTQEQWNGAYPSWQRGGYGWNRYRLGGTYIHAALTWYQHIHRPGSKEWRPPVIMRAVELHAGAQPEVQP